MKYDYKATLSELLDVDGKNKAEIFVMRHRDRLIHALSMMQKLEEPSEGMIEAGDTHDANFHNVASSGEILNAMLEQAKREIADVH